MTYTETKQTIELLAFSLCNRATIIIAAGPDEAMLMDRRTPYGHFRAQGQKLQHIGAALLALDALAKGLME